MLLRDREAIIWRIKLLRAAAVLTSVCLAACIVSCGKKQAGTDGAETTYRIGVTLLTKSHPFYQEMEAAMKESAAKHGLKLNIQSAEFDMRNQQAQIENFITQRVDALVVCPVDSDTIGGTIQQANAAGIPVFTADIGANEGDAVCHIASDNVAGGRLAGRYMAKLLKGKGEIIIIDHPKDTSVRERTQGFVEEIGKCPGIQIIARPPGEAERTTAMSVMETMLQSHPEIDGVFGINDCTALGALAALRQAKREDIVIVGYDGDPEARAEILRGSPLKADTVQYPRKTGSITIEMVVKYLSGEEVPKTIPVEVGIIDKASLEAEK